MGSERIEENHENNARVVRTRWMNKDTKTILLTIPHQFRKKYQLEEPTNALMIPTAQGILIRKLETEDIE
jgi:hypothetical protein